MGYDKYDAQKQFLEELKEVRHDPWLFLSRQSFGINFKVILDNDETIVLVDVSEDCHESVRIPDWVGNAPGVGDLLDALGIPWENC